MTLFFSCFGLQNHFPTTNLSETLGLQAIFWRRACLLSRSREVVMLYPDWLLLHEFRAVDAAAVFHENRECMSTCLSKYTYVTPLT